MYPRAGVVVNSDAAKRAMDPILYTINYLLKSRPKLEDDIPHIVDFARAFGGNSIKTFCESV